MTQDQEGTAKYENKSDEACSHKASPVYLWQGFSGIFSCTTFDIFSNIVIKDIAFGDNHGLFLTEDGQVFVKGQNDCGQLGTGLLDAKVIGEPMKLQGLADAVTHISCGRSHSAVVTDIGQVFCWGSSKEGQCGTGSLDVVLTPTQVIIEINQEFCEHGVPKPISPEVITGIACGASHTLAVSEVGEVWTWGRGFQLGLGDINDAPVPRRINTLQGCTAVAVCCGERHSMALVLRGDKRPSGSSSSLKSKGKTEARSVVKNDLYPSRCAMCNNEIYTFTDTSDMCIIDTLHVCDVNESMHRVDSTIVEDMSSSISSEAQKRSVTCSPEEENIDKEMGRDLVDHDSLLNDSSQMDESSCDTSVLVIPLNSSFDGGDSAAQVGACAAVQPGNDNSLTSSDTCHQAGSIVMTANLLSLNQSDNGMHESDISKATLSSEISISKLEASSHKSLSGKSISNLHQHDGFLSAVGKEDGSARDRTLSSESDGEVWKRRSVSDDEGEELGVLAQRYRTHSPSAPSIKSLNLSGAREYLQRQFEDETPDHQAEASPLDDGRHEESGSKMLAVVETSPSEESPTLHGYMSGYPSFMLAQMKSMTGKAFMNIQALSMFSSTRDLPEGKKIQDPHSSIELSSMPGRSSIMRSGTFIEWTRDMASVDADPASLTKDSDQRSLRTIEMQRENLNRASLSSKSDCSASQSPQKHVDTATDVWVWGCNDQGQLGLRDQLDRAVPTIIKLFTGRHVIKLAAGENHNLALTANSQVYSWGSNSYGQLGQPEDVHVPTRIKFVKGFTAWDIGAGASHSIFLGDTVSMHPDVLYCGKHPSTGANTSEKNTTAPLSIAKIKQLRWITKIMAGGMDCACKVLDPAPPESEPMFELAGSERVFYTQLIKTTNLLLRPLQRSYFYTSMDVYPFKTILQNLVSAFGALTKKIGEGITDLTRCIQMSAPLSHSLILGSHSEFVEAFCTYSQTFSDFLAIGGFDYCTRTGSDFFEKIQGSIRDLSSEERDKSVTASSLFLRAMRYPFFRLAEYSRIISRIMALVVSPVSKSQLQRIVLDWDGLKISFTSEHKMADTTRAFWETAFPKLTDTLRKPERRVLRDSKTHPLQMPSGGKFSSRICILFNDIFFMQSTSMTSFPLETLWVESGGSEGEHDYEKDFSSNRMKSRERNALCRSLQIDYDICTFQYNTLHQHQVKIKTGNVITIIAPEEKLEVQTSTPAQKAEWLVALNSAISKALAKQKSIPTKRSSGERFVPPLIRHASHTFVKAGPYKDAVYDGTWLSGKIHGVGTLKWRDGSTFEGNFKRELMQGYGTYTIMTIKGKEVQKGTWKDGKLNGLATVKYVNGDLYEGYFQDGQRGGHGMYQAGHYKSSYASVYIGEWLHNLREGYGVHDDILKGEKYMGIWTEDHRHGSGVLVTLDGMYYEGNFVQDKLVGFGVIISDDNTLYEGEFMDITHLSGKGTLTLPAGDKLDGSFSGTLNEGLKVNCTFIKSATTPDIEHRSHPAGVKSKYFGRLGVHADAKWTATFSYISSVLGQTDSVKSATKEDTYKAWEVVAVTITAGRTALKVGTGMSPRKLRVQEKTLENLDKIPSHAMSGLNTKTVEELAAYLSKACDCIYHPLGQLIDSLVNAFRASYIGIGAHPRLLHHAVLEMKSYIRRLYRVVRILFPALPPKGGPLYVYPPLKSGDIPKSTDEAREFIEGLETEDPNAIVFTIAGLLYPILLPKIYPPLFDLYALYNEKNDDRYWERVSRLNRQSDLGLLAYLGIEQRFWLMEYFLQQDTSQILSTVKNLCYPEAVDTLQQLSTAFSPIEKLKIIEQTFNEITKTVTVAMKDDHMWCMDDLFPIFQFVVVRAKIRHLGAEIHMVDDLIEPHLEHGEFGLMFTTLKACYFQIQNEKMPHH